MPSGSRHEPGRHTPLPSPPHTSPFLVKGRNRLQAEQRLEVARLASAERGSDTGPCTWLGPGQVDGTVGRGPKLPAQGQALVGAGSGATSPHRAPYSLGREEAGRGQERPLGTKPAPSMPGGGAGRSVAVGQDKRPVRLR